jgi:hypothetical protein
VAEGHDQQFDDLEGDDLRRACLARSLDPRGTDDELRERLREHQKEMDRTKSDDELREKYGLRKPSLPRNF